jgi:hypothetical protein
MVASRWPYRSPLADSISASTSSGVKCSRRSAFFPRLGATVRFTLVGATTRGYTVVIPVDTTAASTDYETAIGFYQILNQGNGNLTNQPLKPKAPTLSRTDNITFQ